MEYIAQTGMAAFHYDSKNKPEESMEIIGDHDLFPHDDIVRLLE